MSALVTILAYFFMPRNDDDDPMMVRSLPILHDLPFSSMCPQQGHVDPTKP